VRTVGGRRDRAARQAIAAARARRGVTIFTPLPGKRLFPARVPSSLARTLARMPRLPALLLALLAPAAMAAPPPALLLPGDYPAGGSGTRSGESWLALVVDEDHSALIASAVSVEAVADPVFGDAPGERVAAPGLPAEPLALLRELPLLRAGDVVTVLAEPKDLARDLPLVMFLNSAEAYKLALDCGPLKGDRTRERCGLVFSRGGQQQVLGQFEGTRVASGQRALGIDAAPALLWTGDIDRDGRLDLLLDLSDRYDLGATSLFLSTAAGAGELVGRAVTQARRPGN
jgi:hypothetical protein